MVFTYIPCVRPRCRCQQSPLLCFPSHFFCLMRLSSFFFPSTPPPPPPPPPLSGDIPIGSLPVTSPRILPQDGYNYIGKNETKESIPHGHPWPREKSRIANEQVLTLDPGQDKRKEEGRTQAGKQPTRKIREREGREGERELIGKHAESTKGQSPGHKTRPHHASPSAFLGGQREPPPSPRNLSSVQWWKECLHA